MRTSSVVAASTALVAGANAWAGNVTYTTEVLTAYTTYCPSSTEIVHGTKTYTVTEATTLTITDCPCTVTKPAYSPPVIYSSAAIVVSSSSPCPVTYTSTPVPVVYTSTPVASVPSETPVPVVYTSTPVPVVYTSTPVASIPVPVESVPVGSSVVYVPPPAVTPSSPVYVNSTVPVVPTVVPPPVGTGVPSAGSPTGSQPPQFTGAANKAFSASSAGLAAVLGLAAYML